LWRALKNQLGNLCYNVFSEAKNVMDFLLRSETEELEVKKKVNEAKPSKKI
jgi:hypothetical protein